MSVDLGQAHGSIVLDFDGSGIAKAMAALDQITESSLVSDSALQQVGDTLNSFGKIGTDALGSAVKSAADFQTQLSNLGAVGGAEAMQNLEAIRETALALGQDTAFSASEAAAGMTELVKAGLPVQDVLDGAAKAALDLAAATGTDVADSAAMMATALNVFGDGMTGFATEGEKAVHIADLLAQTANASASDVTGIGEALAQVGNVADSFGISIEETTAAIGMMADAGIKGSDAGTSLKTALLSLLDPTDKQSAAMAQLGLSYNDFYNADGSFKGMSSLAETLQTSMEGLTDQQKQNALAVLFGADAYRAAKVLADAGAEGFDNFAERQAAAGTVGEQAAFMMDNLNGALSTMQSAIEGLAIKVGSIFLPMLQKIVEGATAVINVISNLPTPILAAVAGIAGIASVALLALGGMMLFGNQIIALVAAMRSIGPAVQLFTGSLKLANAGLQTMGLSFGALGVVLAVGAALVIAYQTNFLGFRDAVDGVIDVIQRFIGLFKSFFDTNVNQLDLNPVSAALAAFGNALQKVTGLKVGAWFTGVANDLQHLIDKVQDAISWFTDIFSIGMAFSDFGNPISRAFDGIGKAIDAVAKQFLGIDNLGATEAFQNIAQAVDNAAAQIQAAFDFIGSAIQSLLSYIGGLISTFRSLVSGGMDPVAAAVKVLSDAFPVLAGVFEFVGASLNNLRGIITGVVNGLGDAVTALFNLDFAGFVEGLVRAWSAPLKGLVEQWRLNFGAIESFLTDIDWSAVADAIGNAAKDAGEAIADWAKGIGDALLDMVGSVDWAGLAASLLAYLSNAASQAAAALPGMISDFISGATGFVLTLASATINIGKWLLGKYVDFQKWIWPLIFKGALELPSLVVNIGKWILGKYADFWALIKSKIGFDSLDIPSIAINIKNWAFNAALNFGDAIMNFIGQAKIVLGTVVAAIGDWLPQPVKDLWATLVTWLGTASITLQKVAANIAAWGVAAVTPIVTSILEWVGDAIGIDLLSVAANIKEWGVTAATDLWTAIKSFLFGGGGNSEHSTGVGGQSIDLESIAVNIKDWALGALADLSTIATSIAESIGTALETAIPGVDWSGIWASVCGYGDVILDGITAALESLKKAWDDLTSGISGYIAELEKIFAEDGWAGVGKKLFEDLKTKVDELKQAFQEFKDKVQDISDTIGPIIQNIVDWISKIEIPQAVKDALDWLGEKTGLGGEGGVDANTLSDNVGNALLEAGDFGANLVNNLQTAIETADWTGVSSAVSTNLQAALDNALEGGGGVQPGLGGTGTGFGYQIVASITRSVNDASWTPFQTAVRDKMSVSFYDAWVEVTDSVKGLFEGMNETTFQPFVDEMVRIVTTGFDTLTTAINGKMDDIVRALTADIIVIETQFTELATNIATAAETAMSNFNTAITSGMATAVATITEQVASMLKSVDDAAAEAEKSGANFAEGYARGIASGTDAVTKAASDLAAAAIAAIQTTQEEGSPSRITMQSGKWFSEGYALGIGSNSDMVAGAAARLFDAAYGQLSGASRTGSQASQWSSMFDRIRGDMQQRMSALDRSGDLTVEINTVIDDTEMGRYVIGKTIAPLSLAAERVGNRRQRY